MSRGRRMQAQGESTTETQAALRANRVAGWLRVPLIVAALLAIPTIIVQESELGGIWEVLATVLDWCIWAMFAANLLIMLYRSGPAALVDKHQVRLVAQLGREGFQSLSRVVPTSIE